MKGSGEHASLAAEAYAVVRRRILRGEIGLGQVISRRKLASELSMSFLPVSEALQRLEFEGLLESRPRAGTRVRIPSADDVKGQYVVREALEAEAAVRFTQSATDAERQEMRGLALEVDTLADGGDRAAFVAAHHTLHARIAEYARCPVLRAAIDRTHALSSIWFCAMGQPPADDPALRHQDLVAALCSGDSAAASAAVRAHLAGGMAHALQTLQPYFRLRTATGRTFHRTGRKLPT